ncbi:MAG TPA: glycosyl hydrolase family protein [Chloroflexi bacterium]|nr:glycosyl hydrolase family protein [Chloroflexota bacterium]
MIYYGAQYYRAPTPRPEDWERDLNTMADMGFNIVRFWAMWNFIQVSEEEFDFSHLDRLMEIAAQAGLKVIINLIPENAPYWLAEKYPHARYLSHTGKRIDLMARPNTPGGGWPGLCFDNDEVMEMAWRFFQAVASRYKGHPALYGYDVWNEPHFEVAQYFGEVFCYCEATQEKFRQWLKGRYGSLENLNAAWARRYTDWNQVHPPRFFGGYPDWIDWCRFKLETHRKRLKLRKEWIKEVDPEARVLSHGIAYIFSEVPMVINDEWELAEEVEEWGVSTYPGVFEMNGEDLFYLMVIMDLTRSAARGKRFWASEMQASFVTLTWPLTFGAATQQSKASALRAHLIASTTQQRILSKARKMGGLDRTPALSEADYRVWNWAALMSGAKGVIYWQWRNESLGPEAPSGGLTNPDGSPNARTYEAARFARFVREHSLMEKATPFRGEIGVVFAPESWIFNYVAQSDVKYWGDSVLGVYRALYEANYQVDFVKRENFGDYRCLYLPFPLMLESETAQALAQYVADGGILISEACPAQFVEGGFSSAKVPGQGLDRVFGTGTSSVDAREGPYITYKHFQIPAGFYQQKLEPEGAEVLGYFNDGFPAITLNRYGKGVAVLIGSYPGMVYHWTRDPEAKGFLLDLLEMLGVNPRVSVSDSEVKARVLALGEAFLLYVINGGLKPKQFVLKFSEELGTLKSALNLADGTTSSVKDNTLALSLSARDGLAMVLK